MPNPTRQEIIEAYRELYMLLGFYQDRNPERAPRTRAIIEHVLPPCPRPTMAEVEWDDDKHYLAEAESDLFGTVIMLAKNEDGHIEFFVPKEKSSRTDESLTRTLTPTGKRYELKEIQE